MLFFGPKRAFDNFLLIYIYIYIHTLLCFRLLLVMHDGITTDHFGQKVKFKFASKCEIVNLFVTGFLGTFRGW